MHYTSNGRMAGQKVAHGYEKGRRSKRRDGSQSGPVIWLTRKSSAVTIRFLRYYSSKERVLCHFVRCLRFDGGIIKAPEEAQ